MRPSHGNGLFFPPEAQTNTERNVKRVILQSKMLLKAITMAVWICLGTCYCRLLMENSAKFLSTRTRTVYSDHMCVRIPPSPGDVTAPLLAIGLSALDDTPIYTFSVRELPFNHLAKFSGLDAIL